MIVKLEFLDVPPKLISYLSPLKDFSGIFAELLIVIDIPIKIGSFCYWQHMKITSLNDVNIKS